MNIRNQMLKRKQFYENRIAETKDKLEELAEGQVYIDYDKRLKQYRWTEVIYYQPTGKTLRTRFPLSGEQHAEDFALRMKLEQLMDDDLTEIRAIDAYLNTHCDCGCTGDNRRIFCIIVYIKHISR